MFITYRVRKSNTYLYSGYSNILVDRVEKEKRDTATYIPHTEKANISTGNLCWESVYRSPGGTQIFSSTALQMPRMPNCANIHRVA
jgi:hypothetical protein